MKTKKNVLILFAIFCIYAVSCRDKDADAKKYLPGRYTYRIPTGEIEVLVIYPGFTFKHILYAAGGRRILYENSGTIHVNGEDIELEHWLECYKPEEVGLVPKPQIVYATGIFWRAPNNSQRTSIFMFDETGYVFLKDN